MHTHAILHQQVNASAVVLCMKGMLELPQCGLSGSTVQMLQACSVKSLTAVDVLDGPGIKACSNWPTIPQLYAKGEFNGRADIVREFHQTSELHTLLDAALA